MFNITIFIILVNKTTEFVIVQKLYQLCEYICLYSFVIILKDYKIKNSNRHALNTVYKKLYFSDLKEQLAYFNGIVLSLLYESFYYSLIFF